MKKWVCQQCKLEKIKQRAKTDRLVVTIQASIDDVGFDVFVHPDDVVIPPHVRGRDKDNLPEVKYWRTWLFDDYDKKGCECDR
jgi:hypothetical protein